MSGALVVRLPASGLGTTALGGKGANLGRLMELGHSVPPAWVVLARAYEEHLARPTMVQALDEVRSAPESDRASRLSALRRLIVTEPLDPALAAEIAAAVAELPAGPLAARSSAAQEDSASASYAGQHETVLGVTGAAACGEAVKRCWASAWTGHALAYRLHCGLAARDVAMAVVIQEQVPAEAAGVMFTCDPVSGRRDRIVIEAVPGLGEGLVSGKVEPDRMVLSRDLQVIEWACAASRGHDSPPLLTDDQLRSLARIGLSLEREMEFPQDVEWALAGGRLFILQTRPVTTMTVSRDPADYQVWANTNTGELLPNVATPMTFSMLKVFVNLIFGQTFRKLGVEIDRMPVLGTVAGRVYFNISVFNSFVRIVPGMGQRTAADLFGGDRAAIAAALAAMPPEFEPRLAVSRLSIIARVPGFVAWLLSRFRRPDAERFAGQVRERFDQLDRIDLASLADAELFGLQASAAAAVAEAHDGVAYAIWGIVFANYLGPLCRRWLGDEDGSIMSRLLWGTGNMDSAESGLDLWRLAEAAREPEVEAVVADATSFAELREALIGSDRGRNFLARWDDFMARHGHHARSEVDVFTPRWREQPDYILSVIQSYGRASGPSPLERHRERAAESEQLLESCLTRIGPLRGRLFKYVVRRARAGMAMRENVKSQGAVRMIAVSRKIILEIGRRLSRAGTLPDPESVFFLDLPELTDLLGGKGGPDVKALTERRRDEYRRNLDLQPPSVVVGRFDPRQCPPPPALPPRRVYTGIAVSPGVAEGPARVILHADSDERVLPGEILVAPFTDPGWTPYFIPAAAVVVDMGGLLSHGSVVAREYGLPAVVNVGPASRLIKTGQRLRVDGGKGEVWVLDDGEG